MSNIIPPTEKNKILKNDNDNDVEDYDSSDIDELYLEEKQEEYEDETVLYIQKAMLDYVDRKSLTICEYLSTARIRRYLRNRK